MRRSFLRTAVVVLLLGGVQVLQAQPSPAMMQRVRDTIAALNAGPEAYEQYARDHFSSAYLAEQSPEERRAFVARVRQELGRVSPQVGLDRESATRIRMDVQGAAGKRARLILDHEPQPPLKITGLRLQDLRDDPGEPPPVPVNATMDDSALRAALEPYLSRLAADGRFSGVLLVARDGRPVVEAGHGYANRSDGVPNTPATRFNIGSINKAFTKLALGQLMAAGRLRLGDTIGTFLPDYPNADAKRVTIDQLVTHTAGLANLFDQEFRQAAKSRFRQNRDYYAFVAPKPLEFEPGTREAYCNSCYIVLGEIIARISGLPYETYVDRHIFQPAGMSTAGFFHRDDVRPNLAIGYTRVGTELRANTYLVGAGGSAAGSAFATAGDLLAFENAVRDGKLLGPEQSQWFFGLTSPPTERVTAARGIAGGTQGANAAVVAGGPWIVVTLSNFDGPLAERLASAIARALSAN